MGKGPTVLGPTSGAREYPEKALTEQIIGCAIAVHKALGPGFLESVYENALRHELTKQGLQVQQQLLAEIIYDGAAVGEHRLDLLVEQKVIVELKHVESIHDKHVAQVISMLKAFGVKVGLLINFNEARLTNGVRRVVF